MGTVLLLGTGFSAIPIYEALIENHDVTVIGGERLDPLAQQSSYFNLDYSNTSEVYKFFTDHKFDFIVPACNDAAFKTASAIGRHYGVPGYDDLSYLLLDKFEFRKRLIGKSYNIPYDENLLSLRKQISEQEPSEILLKPRSSHSGIGIQNLTYDINTADTKLNNSLFEKKIIGTLHSHSIFLSSGDVVADFLVDEFPSKFEFAVGKSNTPSRLPYSIFEQIKSYSKEIANLFEIKSGLLHIQYIVDRENKIWAVEAMRRCPGDFYGDLVQRSTNYNYYSAYVSSFIGKKPKALESSTQEPVGRLSVYPSQRGRLLSIEFNFKSILGNNCLTEIDFLAFAHMYQQQDTSVSHKTGICFLYFDSTKSLWNSITRIGVLGQVGDLP